jgi:hypothetical protein
VVVPGLGRNLEIEESFGLLEAGPTASRRPPDQNRRKGERETGRDTGEDREERNRSGGRLGRAIGFSSAAAVGILTSFFCSRTSQSLFDRCRYISSLVTDLAGMSSRIG